MIYFLLRAGSYRAWEHIGQGRLRGVHSTASLCAYTPCTPVHSYPCTHVCTHIHACSSTCAPAVSSPHGTWQDVGCAAGRATPGSLCHAQGTPSMHDTPHRPCRQRQPCFMSPGLCSVGLGAVGKCQIPSGSSERGWRPPSVGLAHTVLSSSPQNQPFPGHCQPMHPQTLSVCAGSPVFSYPLPSCSTQQVRGAHGSKGEGMGIWGTALRTATVSHDRTACGSPALLAFTTAQPLPSSCHVPDTA